MTFLFLCLYELDLLANLLKHYRDTDYLLITLCQSFYKTASPGLEWSQEGKPEMEGLRMAKGSKGNKATVAQ